MSEGSKIVLPDDKELRDKLRKKLEEYLGRISESIKQNPYRAPELIMSTDAGYKAEIVEMLLKTGEVNTWELSRELCEKYGGLNVPAFNNAAGVINDYCQTGGKNTRGGTGL